MARSRPRLPSLFSPSHFPTRDDIVCGRRLLHDAQEFFTKRGQVKVQLDNLKVVGSAQSRGERPYQEDTYSVGSLSLPLAGLRSNLKGIDAPKRILDWQSDQQDHDTHQVLYAAVFDGHGGDQVSKFLQSHLPRMILDAKSLHVPSIVGSYRAIGGYLRRFTGGILERLAKGEKDEHLSLSERVTLAFLTADSRVAEDEQCKKSGSTATVALLHSLDEVPMPFFLASELALTIAHVGDTRAILCSARTGRTVPLTEAHHAESRVESERLRRLGTGLITDSFGESRWGGSLANTRGIGDRNFKRLGVTGEPDVVRRVLKGDEWAFLILMSDGISGIISDQEVADLCRDKSNPMQAAEAIVRFAENVGGNDNMTCIVLPFRGWKRLGGVDSSFSRREFRLRNAVTGASRR